METGNLLRRMGKCCVSFALNGIDYIRYIVEEITNPSGKRNEWGDELSKIKPMPAEITHTHHTSTGKINLRMTAE